MDIKYQISPYPSLMEDMIAKIWEADNDAPGAEVRTVVIPEDGGGGHPNIATIDETGFDLRPHIIRLFTEGGFKLHEYTMEAFVNGIVMFDPIRFKIGDGGEFTPEAGTNNYINPILLGLGDEDYEVFRNNYGILFPQLHYTTDPGSGAWAFNGDDDFGPNEEFVIKRKASSNFTAVHDSVVGKWFGDFVDIAADTDYAPEHLRKLIRFVGNATFTYQAGAVPIGYGMVFQNFGSSVTGKVKFLNASLKFGAITINEINIPSFTEAAFSFDGDNWNVIYLTDSRWANAAISIPPGTILGVGEMAVGNVPAGDNYYVATHNKAIVGDYYVMLSIRGTDATKSGDNNLFAPSWWHHATDKPNKFNFSVEEVAASVQNITICYMLIKK